MKRTVLGVVIVIACLLGCARPLRARSPMQGAPQLSVLSFNVNFGARDAPGNLAAIVAADADVVLLQETTPALERAARRQLKARYPHQLFRQCCRAGGLGVLSKVPFEDMDYLDSPIGWFPGWWVRLDSPLGPVQVLLVHLRPPVSDSGSWVKGYFTTAGLRHQELAAYLERRAPGIPTIVAGDFNEARGKALDLLADRGLTDAVDALAPGTATWRWTTSVGTLRFTLDHVYHDDRLRALTAEVHDAGASDHLPVKVVFEQAPPPGGNGKLL